MNTISFKESDTLLATPPRRRVWRFLLLFLITAVVFVTTYALVLPAITLTPEEVDSGDNWTVVKTGEEYTITFSGTGVAKKTGWSDTYKTLITEVVIDEGITGIDQSAFSGCSNLKTVTIPDSVTSIGIEAFSYCKALNSIAIPDSVTSIGTYAFYNCTSLATVTISENSQLQSIGTYAFRNCTSLTSITIPDSVTSIGTYAFYNCTSLATVTISENSQLQSIGSNAFRDCTSLTSITIPDSVTSIGNAAFYNCTSLATVTFSENSQLQSIGSEAFRGCTKLNSITIPDGVTRMGDHAFYNCDALTSITIPNGVTSIGNYVFYACDALVSVTIPDGVTSIGNDAFGGCAFTSITIPDSVTSIGKFAFSGCEELTSITIPNSVTSIGDYAFSSCTSLTSLTIPASVKTIGKEMFSSCNALKTVTFSDDSQLESIPERAFYQFQTLTSINIPDSVKTIGKEAFAECKALETVTISDDSQLESIDERAFYQCEKLTSINIPDSVKTIGKEAFAYCESLESIYIPKNIKTIEKFTFSQCKQLTTVTIANESQLETVGAYAFFSSGLIEIDLPDTVTLIDTNAFDYCRALKKVDLGDCLKQIAGSAFMECSNLDTVELPATLERIQTQAFYGTALREITIPEKVCEVGEKAFGACRLLKTVNWNAKACPEIHSDAFKDGINEDYTIIIGKNVESLPKDFGIAVQKALHGDLLFEGPNDKITLSADAMVGLDFPLCTLNGDYYVDEHGVIYNLDKTTLLYCPPELESYTVPDGVTTVAPRAFSLARDLKTVTFENSSAVKSIGTHAFYDCTALTSVNGETSVSEATALFTNATVAVNAFENSGLSGSAIGGATAQDLLDFSQGGMSLTIGKSTTGTLDENNCWQLLTGVQTMIPITAQVTGPADTECRVYVQFSDSDFLLDSMFKPGETTTINGVSVTTTVTADPDVYCLSFAPTEGATFSVTMKNTYPSKTTDGGVMRVWGEVVSKGTPINPALPETFYEYHWSTERKEYDTVKSARGDAPTLIGKGDGTNYAQFNGNFSWEIQLQQTNTGVSDDYGVDTLQRIRYTDVITLPKAVSWNAEFANAIENDTYRFENNFNPNRADFYYPDAEGNYVYALNVYVNDGAYSLTPDKVELKDGKLYITWDLYLRDNTATFTAPTVYVDLYPAATVVDTSLTKGAEATTINNAVKTTSHYTFSEDVSDSSDASHTFKEPQANMTYTKSTSTNSYSMYLGEAIRYQLAVKNTGAAVFTGDLTQVYDPLANVLYVKPDDMQAMFGETHGDKLTITINGAKLYTPISGTAIGIDGKTPIQLSTANSSKDTDPKTATLAITKAGDRYCITCTIEGQEATSAEYDSVAAGLNALGYAVTTYDTYTLTWDVSRITFYGGTEVKFDIYSTLKDTFGYLHEDHDLWYAWPKTDEIKVQNKAHYIIGEDRSDFKGTITDRFTYDLSVGASLSVNGENYDSADPDRPKVKNQDFLDFSIGYVHYGTGVYKDMPIVSELSGAQSVLVPVDKNQGRPWVTKHLPVVVRDGVEYYRLDAADTYKGVWVGTDKNGKLMFADSVTVEVEGDDRTTTIKWYVPELTGKTSGTITVPSQIVADDLFIFSFNDIVTLNDKENDRLTAGIGGQGTALDYKKQIVTKNPDLTGDAPDAEVLDEDDFSIISDGDTVTYKITLTCNGVGDRTLNGTRIFDRLPQNFGVFDWADNITNITIRAREPETEISMDGWYVTNESPNAEWEAQEGQQYLCWPEENYITFHCTEQKPSAEVYLYITMKYPVDDADKTVYSLWDEYCDGVGTDRLENTVYVNGFPDNVVHDLVGDSQMLLQKGVYSIATSYYINNARAFTQTQSSRNYYNNVIHYNGNSAYVPHYEVTYYVALYNPGNTRMYISNLYDKLPDGFTVGGFPPSSVDPDKIVNLKTNDGIKPNYRTASIAFNGERIIINEGGKNPLEFDDKEERYYLGKGDALVFTYTVRVDRDIAKTTKEATNTVGMPIYNPLRSEIFVDDQTEITGGNVSGITDTNDGECDVITGEQAAKKFETDTETETQWLVSEVSVIRDDVVPGIKKSLSSKINNAGEESEPGQVLAPTDTLGWTIETMNDSHRVIDGYTLTDTTDIPYRFAPGYPVTYSLTDTAEYANSTLFTIKGREGDKITLSSAGKEYTLTVDGDPVQVTTNYKLKLYPKATEESLSSEITVRFYRESDGRETMAITFPEGMMPLRVGAKGVLKVYTENPKGPYNNKVYSNQAKIIPLEKYDKTRVQHGTNTTDENGNNAGVVSTAFATVATGYATTAEKVVTAKGDPANTASSALSDDNAILLKEGTDLFTYTLKVSNVTDIAMQKLVLIDNLPQKGDHHTFVDTALRGSTATVQLANTPNFKVTVTDAKGNETVLSSDQYTIQYSTKTAFSVDDRSGTTNNGWDTSQQDARSIRIIITDDAMGTDLIPLDATVSVSFDCRIDSPEPGDVVWNNFGYRYGLKGIEGELEAQPLVVGVKVPSAPTLEKVVVDRDNEAYPLPEETSFTFVVYEGNPLEDADVDKNQLIAQLQTAGRAYHTFEIPVAAGGSNAAMRLSAEDWTWEDGKTYTIVEVASNDQFRFDHWNNIDKDRSYSFTYNVGRNTSIKAINALREWDLQLIKTDEEDHSKVLGNAVFALYSADETEAISDAEYKTLGDDAPEKTLLLDGETWYLVSLQTTAANNGSATWGDLKGETYYLLEVKPPNGYLPLEKGLYISRPENENDETRFVSVKNKAKEYVLPQTGGNGLTPIYAVGSTLVLSACALYIATLLKKRRTNSSK